MSNFWLKIKNINSIFDYAQVGYDVTYFLDSLPKDLFTLLHELQIAEADTKKIGNLNYEVKMGLVYINSLNFVAKRGFSIENNEEEVFDWLNTAVSRQWTFEEFVETLSQNGRNSFLTSIIRKIDAKYI